MSILNIAIDGPAGAGKSTIAKAVAQRLSYIYVDTGAMYRAIGYYVFKHYLKSKEIEGELGSEELNKLYDYIEGHLDSLQIVIKYKEGSQHIYLNKEDVTDLIRSSQMGKLASIVSGNKKVRLYLVHLQQNMAKVDPVVMDGRDIGTHVLPNAKLKIYLTASSEIRAKRRYDQMKEAGQIVDFEELKKDIEDRDFRDMNREYAPLKQAEDALLLDSSDMTITEVVDYIYSLAKQMEA